MTKKIYLASPLGFSEIGREYYNNIIIPKIKNLGFEILDPWKENDTLELRNALNLPISENKVKILKEINYNIGKTNRELIDSCDILFAILDGTDVDSGTASEIAYAFAKKKLILAYRGDFRLSSENISGIVNIQVEYFIRESNGNNTSNTIFTQFSDVIDELKKYI
ncbi:MAG: nucleoside 2-deoxyribosyltransferase [Nanoarchaeota archaeon]|nr:nucleoside 2-deoxyribosyltransferase [Nanoarchaeota archaeon]